MIKTFFMHILILSFICSFFILALIFIRKLNKKNYTAKWYYIAWIFLALRMILPLDFLFPFHLFTIPIGENEISSVGEAIGYATVYSSLEESPTLKQGTSYIISAPIETPAVEISSNYPISEVTFATNSVSDNDTSYIITTPTQESTITQDTTIAISSTENIATEIAVSKDNRFSFYSVIPYVWFFGVILFLLIYVTQYLFFKRTVNRWRQRISDAEIMDIFQTLCKDMQIKGAVEIYLCKKVSTPMVIGFFHPILLLPSENFSSSEIYFIIKHELVHLKRNDLWIKLLLLVANAIHFFNPLAYAMVYFANQEIELSCDSDVIEEEPFEIRKSYSQTILNSIKDNYKFTNSLTSSFIGNKNILKSRFQNIFDENKKKKGFFTLILLLLLVLCSGIFIAFGKNNASAVVEENTTSTNESSLASTLFQYKTDFIGDNVKVLNIISNLPSHEDVTYNSIQLQTAKQPYQLSIYYTMDSMTTKRKWAISKETFYNDAVILLSLIQNLDEVTIYLEDKENPDFDSSFSFKRKEIEKNFNQDMRSYAKEETTFSEFLDDLYSTTETNNISSETAQIIEKNLEAITSSPKESSNSNKHIQTHSNEYETILKTGKEGLNYMLSEFKADRASGLKGTVMAKLCIELLGNEYASNKNDWSTPKEWYDSLSIYPKTVLPSYKHQTKDKMEMMTYIAALNEYSNTEDPYTVTIVAPKIFKTIETDSEISIYTTVLSNDYEFIEDTLYPVNERIVPAKIVYEKEGTKYELKEWIQAKGGSEFIPSIQEFCEDNKQLAQDMISEYNNHNQFSTLIKENIKEYITTNKIPAKYYENENGEKVELF